MRPGIKLILLGAVALTLGGCGYALIDTPRVARPADPLRAQQRTSPAGKLRVVCVAAAGHRTVFSSFVPESAASRALAEGLQRAVLDTLAAHAVDLVAAGAPPRGEYGGVAAFDAIDVSPYREVTFSGRQRLPASWCADDSLLRAPAGRAAWGEVLTSLRRLNGRRPLAVLPHAAELRDRLGADALLIVVARARHVPVGVQIEQGVVNTVLTLGILMPYFERSSTLCNVYLVDLRSGEVLWADACRVLGADAQAAATAWSALIARWPPAR